jgi:hypothetical protein
MINKRKLNEETDKDDAEFDLLEVPFKLKKEDIAYNYH